MRVEIDRARVSVPAHALERWAERIGLSPFLLWPALARATRPGRRLRRRIRQSLCPVFDGWKGGRGLALIDRRTGAAFIIRPAVEGGLVLATVVTLASVGVGPEVMEVSEYAPGFLQEATPCPATA